uniref:ZP domain-containing protein n=1 Tax=Panagrolaimus sp. ES5 TaxID=591445 RepID=A0AC34GH80_9BILA
FVTKVDRVYHIQCFYMEADKTVAQDIQVSDLTTAFVTQLVPMPVYHSWKCDSETQETFCAVVHTCTVDDGNGDTVPILNENGCALDRFLLNNLEYPTDLTAGQEAHVYKYADRSSLFYQCQISITVKEPNTECVRPECAELTRGKRHAFSQRQSTKFDDLSTLDVISQRIETIDAFDLSPDGNETNYRNHQPIAFKYSGDLLTSDIYC